MGCALSNFQHMLSVPEGRALPSFTGPRPLCALIPVNAPLAAFCKIQLWQKEKIQWRKVAPSVAKFLVAWAVNRPCNAAKLAIRETSLIVSSPATFTFCVIEAIPILGHDSKGVNG
jgi:hypothetical protein